MARLACSPGTTCRHCARCWTATRWPTASSPPGWRRPVSTPWRLGAELWGYGAGRLEAACFAGANLVPVGDAPAALAAFAERARRQGRRCSSIVGPARAVGPLWERLEPYWGPARDVRRSQPLLATRRQPPVPGDPGVRRVRLSELDVLMPACVAMFSEEVGTSPLGSDNGAAYRARVRDLVARRPRLRPDRGRRGAVQGRARRGQRAGLPGAGRLGEPGAPRPGTGHPRARRPSSPRRCALSPRW